MPVESGSERSVRYSALEARREFENTVNTVRSQTRAQLTAFDPAEFEAMPASVGVVSAVAPEVVQSKRGNAYYRLDGEVLVRAGASSQPVRETPRQPHGLSLVDPEAPTRFFGRSGQRQVTIAQSDKGLPRALISGDASKWIWSSIDQLDEAVSELVRGSNSRPSSSQASLSAVNVEAEELSQSAVDAGQQNSAVSLPTDPVTGQPQSSVYQWGQGRPVCRSAPPFESRGDMDPPARRRVEFPDSGGTVSYPPVVTSTCGLSMGNVRVGQPTTGQRNGDYGQGREQRDTVNAVAVESALAVASAAVGACQLDCRTGQFQDDPVMVNGSNGLSLIHISEPTRPY